MGEKYWKITKISCENCQTISISARLKQKINKSKYRFLPIIFIEPVLKACGGTVVVNLVANIPIDPTIEELLAVEFTTTPLPNISFEETQTQRDVVYTAEAVNPRLGLDALNILYTISYSITGDDQYFEIDELTGVLTFGPKEGTPEIDYENPQHIIRPDHIGAYTVEIIADMTYLGNIKKVGQEITVSINNVIEDFEFKTIPSIDSIFENRLGTSIYEARAVDKDGGVISYQIEEIEGNEKDLMFFSIDPQSGELRFGIEPELVIEEDNFNLDFENPQDENQDNEYVVTVVAYSTLDGEQKEIRQEIRVQVRNVDEAPIIESNPEVEDDRTIHFVENQPAKIVYQVSATDPDEGQGDAILYVMSGEVDFFYLDQQTGELRFGQNQQQETMDFENPQDENQDNQYIIEIVAVSQGLESKPQTIVLKVINFVEPPIFTTQPQPSITVFENGGDELVYTVQAIGTNAGDVVTYQLGGDDAQFFTFDQETGELTFGQNQQQQINVDFENPQDLDENNEYKAVITATAAGHNIFQDIVVRVINVEEQPELTIETRADGITFNEGDEARIVCDVEIIKEPQQELLRYYIEGDVEYFSINQQGEITFGVDIDQQQINVDFENPQDGNKNNIYEINILARIGQASQNIVIQQQFSIEVKDINEAPERTVAEIYIGSLQEGTRSHIISKTLLLENFFDEDEQEDFSIKKIIFTNVPEQVDRIFYNPQIDLSIEIDIIIGGEYDLDDINEGLYIEIKDNADVTTQPIAISYKLADKDYVAEQAAQIKFDIATDPNPNRPPFISITPAIDAMGYYLLYEQIYDSHQIGVVSYNSVDDPLELVTVEITGDDVLYFALGSNDELFFTGNFNYNEPTDFNFDNIYRVEIIATEEGGLSSRLIIEVKIENVIQDGDFYIGTYSYDEIISSDQDDIIMARESADTIDSGAGDDLIIVVGKVAPGQFDQSDYIFFKNNEKNVFFANNEPNLSPQDITQALELVDGFTGLAGRYQYDIPYDILLETSENIRAGEGNDAIVNYGISSFISAQMDGVEGLYIDGLAEITLQQFENLDNIGGNDLSSKLIVTSRDEAQAVITDLSFVKRVNVIDFTNNAEWDTTSAVNIVDFLPHSQGKIYISGIKRITVNQISDFEQFDNIAIEKDTELFVQDINDQEINVTAQIKNNPNIYHIEFYQIMEIDKNSGIFIFSDNVRNIEYTDIINKRGEGVPNVEVAQFGFLGNDKDDRFDAISLFNSFPTQNNNQIFNLQNGRLVLKDPQGLELEHRLYITISASDKQDNGYVLNSFRKDYIFTVVDTNDQAPHRVFLIEDDGKSSYDFNLDFNPDLIVKPVVVSDIELVIGYLGIVDVDATELNNYQIDFLPIEGATEAEIQFFDDINLELNNEGNIVIRNSEYIANDKTVAFKVKITDRDEQGVIIEQPYEQEFILNFEIGDPQLGIIIINGDDEAVFDLVLDKSYDREIIVKYETNRDKNIDYIYAREGIDYIVKQGEITFLPGEIEKQVIIDILLPEFAKSSIIQLNIDVQARYSGEITPRIFTQKAAVIFGSGEYFKAYQDPTQEDFQNRNYVTNQVNVIIGTDQNDEYEAVTRTYVDAKQGNDRIIGSNSKDYLIGGDGDDYIDGRDGIDFIFGGKGVDTIYMSPEKLLDPSLINIETGTVEEQAAILEYNLARINDDDALYLSLADIADDEDSHQPDIVYGFTVNRYVIRRYSEQYSIADSFIVSDLMLKNGRRDKIDIESYRTINGQKQASVNLINADVFIFDDEGRGYNSAYDAYSSLLDKMSDIDKPHQLAFRLFFWSKEAGRKDQVALSYIMDPGFNDVDTIKFFDLAVFPDLWMDELFNHPEELPSRYSLAAWQEVSLRTSYGITDLQFIDSPEHAIKNVQTPITSKGGVTTDGRDPYTQPINEPDKWYSALATNTDDKGDEFFEYSFREGQAYIPLNWNYVISQASTEPITEEHHQRFISKVLGEIGEIIQPDFRALGALVPYNDVENPNRIYFNFLIGSDVTAKADIRYGVYISQDFADKVWGQQFEYVILHEVGHIIGLEHPTTYVPVTGRYNLEAYSHMPWFQDYPGYTVMSYNFNYKTMDGGYTDEIEILPTTYGLYDIVQLHKQYGVGQSKVGDTVYGINGIDTIIDIISGDSSTRAIPLSLKADSVQEKIAGTIFDTAGDDIIDVSHYGGPQIVTLEQGKFSSVTGLRNNLAIAFGTDIENLKTGAGDDYIITNSLDNTIDAGAGNDVIVMKQGADIITGGEGDDVFVFLDSVNQDATIQDFGRGSDKLDFSRLFAETITSVNYQDYISAQLVIDADGGEKIHIKIDTDGSLNRDTKNKIAELVLYGNTDFDIDDFFDDFITVQDISPLLLL